MKTLLTILVLLSFPALSQNLDTGDKQRVEDIRMMEEEAAMQAEEAPEEEVMTDEATDKTNNERIQVECQCPPPVQNEEVAPVNSVFPPDSVFFIAPQPAPVPEVQEETKPQENLPPGYGGKMSPGYSDDTYKQIQ